MFSFFTVPAYMILAGGTDRKGILAEIQILQNWESPCESFDLRFHPAFKGAD